jgi:hypothetical protein
VPIERNSTQLNISGIITNYETFLNQRIFDKIKEYIFKEEKIFYKDGSHYNQLGNKLLGIEIHRYLKNN